jgi:hypothetical protein
MAIIIVFFFFTYWGSGFGGLTCIWQHETVVLVSDPRGC